MKIVAEQKALATLLAEVSRIVEARGTFVILEHVLLDAADGFLTASCNNLDMDISGRAAATVTAPGKLCAPALPLARFVSSLPPSAQVSLDYADNRLIVKSARARIALPTLPAEDFPVLDAKPGATAFMLPAEDLRELIDRTAFAVGNEQTRHYLCGLYLHAWGGSISDRVLRATATDGHRLSHVSVALPDGASDMPGVIIPRQSYQHLRRLAEGDGNIEIDVSDARLVARFSGEASWRISSKLIDGTFPDYERVVPEIGNAAALVNRPTLLTSIKRIAIAAEAMKGIRGHVIAFEISPGQVSISGGSADAGEAEETIDIAYDGPEIRFGFNSKIISDCLDNMTCEEVEIHIRDAMSPAVLIDPSNRSARVIAVPYRV